MRGAAFAILIAILVIGCGKDEHQIERPERPSEAENPELSDASMRVSGDKVTLRYDDGGVLFCRSNSGEVSVVRLSDDTRVEYDPSAPSLKINGADLGLRSAEIEKRADGTEWHRLVLDDGSDVYIVVAGI